MHLASPHEIPDLAARLGIEARRPGPRLLIDPADAARLGAAPPAGSPRARLLDVLRRGGKRLLETPAVAHRPGGILISAREAEARILTLAVLWRQDGDPRWARRAWDEAAALCGLPSWNPHSFLDTAEATLAVAFALDWAGDGWSGAERDAAAAAIVGKGLLPSRDEASPDNAWITRDNNWNQVGHAGMVLGALAMARREPELAVHCLRRAVRHIGCSARAYAPDGIYPEGPIYWAYGTTFHGLLGAALAAALGDDGGATAFPGFRESVGYLRQVTTPGGRFYAYADSWIDRPSLPILHWFARILGDPSVAEPEYRRLAEGREEDYLDRTRETARFLPLAFLWMNDEALRPGEAPPRAWKGEGEQPLACFRASWDDPGALYAAMKGGRGGTPHAHADMGSFVVEREGIEWIAELGALEYDIALDRGVDLWNYAPESSRWKILHAGSHTHNLVRIDGAGPDVAAKTAKIARFSEGDRRFAVVDLSTLYPGVCASYRRGLALAGPGTVLVVDHFEGLRPGQEVEWRFFTPARMEPTDGGIDLVQEGRRLPVRALDAAEGAWTAASLDSLRQPFDAPARSGWMVSRRVTGREGRLVLATLVGGTASPLPEAWAVGLEAWE